MNLATDLKGPDGYKLWHAHLLVPQSKEWAEYLLYSDSNVSGEILEGLGPFQILNGLPQSRKLGFARAALCLRICFPDVDWIDKDPPKELDIEGNRIKRNANIEYYHGKDFPDEIAALISLILGIRLKAGPQSRR